MQLQSGGEAASVAIEIALQTTVHSKPLVRRCKDAWLLGDTARELMAQAHDPNIPDAVMAYASTDFEAQAQAALAWVAAHGAISTGDLMGLTGTARGTVKHTLVDEGRLVGSGRPSRYQLVRTP